MVFLCRFNSRIGYFSLLFALLLATHTHTVAAQTTAPKEIGDHFVKHMTQLMQVVAQDAETLSQDKVALYQLLETRLAQFVSFSSMARRTMGKHFRSFTREEKNAFLETFKRNLFSAYVQNFLDEQVLAKLPEKYSIRAQDQARFTNKKKTRASQNIVFKNNGTDAEVVIEFVVFYDKKRQSWFVNNIIADGINLGINYRSQFNTLYVEQKGDMQAIIAQWTAQP